MQFKTPTIHLEAFASVQRGSRVFVRAQACSACLDIKATGQAVSEPTRHPVLRRGSGRRSLGPPRTSLIPTGMPASPTVSEERKPVCSWRPSTTLVSVGQTSTASGCCVRCVNWTFSTSWCQASKLTGKNGVSFSFKLSL